MQLEKNQILFVGASRGIGAAVAQHFAQKGDYVISVSRSQPAVGVWIQANISTAEGIRTVVDRTDESRLDALLFMGGVWEKGAFTE
jgi:NAD(P)-dependent dehydrogenase (short-subunit alcohol dehydrogenase family)